MSEEPIRPFKEVNRIDMKIYAADIEDARWFKAWCDKQGIKYSIGIKLMRIAVEKDTMYGAITGTLNDHAMRINQLQEVVAELGKKIQSATEPQQRKIPKRFGQCQETS